METASRFKDRHGGFCLAAALWRCPHLRKNQLIKASSMKYPIFHFSPIFCIGCLFVVGDGLHNAAAADSPLLGITGQGSTGPGGYNLTVSAQVTTTGTTGLVHLVGGATGPVIQVVPPGNDGCACWCINARRTDTLPSDGDQRVNWYIRDTGDGMTTFDQISFITSVGGDCSAFPTSGLFFIPLVQGDFKFVVRDSDGDGVPDDRDQCPGTVPGSVVNEHGCSIDQLVPCAGPATGGTWRNHGEYVVGILRTATAFHKAGLITATEKRAIVRAAVRSDCGRRHNDSK
jgi:hypothetical protein